MAADQRHAGSRRQWADLDHINPDAVPEAHEEMPELSVDHGDRQETIAVGTLIIGHDAGTDAELHVITGLGAGLPRKCQRGEETTEEHTSDLQSLMRSSYAVFLLQIN